MLIMRILFGVLDWGLGHASRDVPFIEGLLKQGHSVDILSTGRALKLLKIRLGRRCRYLDVPSVTVPYTKSKLSILNYLLYSPKMYMQLKSSGKISSRIIREGRYDKVISDGRYDVYDKESNSYTIIHQLVFKSFLGFKSTANRILARMNKRYGRLIVLDFKTNELAGTLSKASKYFDEEKISYIGMSSHIKKVNLMKDIDYFISISGSEPQRTILQDKIMSQVSELKGKIVVAGGNPDIKIKKNYNNAEFHSYLNPAKQEEMMNRAKFIIARSGYTTMMEFAELGIRNALLIPCPGQQEQEVLAEEYEGKKIFHHVHQDDLNLKKDVKDCKNFKGFNVPWKTRDSVKLFISIIEE